MKTVSLYIILLAMAIPGKAQLAKGNLLAGGLVSFESKKYSGDENAATSFTFRPGGGYFFIDKLAGGARISFTRFEKDGDHVREFLAGPFARYYFLKSGAATNLFAEAGAAFGSEKYAGYEAVGQVQFSFAAGPSFFFNEHVALETALGFSTRKYNDDNERYTTWGISMGLQVYLSPKKKKK